MFQPFSSLVKEELERVIFRWYRRKKQNQITKPPAMVKTGHPQHRSSVAFLFVFYLPGWSLLTLFDLLGLWSQKVVGKSKSIGSALRALPKIARLLKPSDSTDRGLLDNKDGGIHCRQGVPCLESLFLSHSAVSNSGHPYLIFRFLSGARSYFNSGKVENATEMSGWPCESEVVQPDPPYLYDDPLQSHECMKTHNAF